MTVGPIISSNPAAAAVTVLIFTAIGIAMAFWGRKILEALASIIFAFLGGVLGLMVGSFVAALTDKFFGISSIVALVIVGAFCLLGIVLGYLLGKSIMYGLIAFYCGLTAFYITWAFFGGEWALIPLVAAFVVGLVVALLVKVFIQRLMAAITAFFGAGLIGYGGYVATILAADRFFDYEFTGRNYLIMIGVIVGLMIVIGICGTIFQLKGPQPKASGGSGGASRGGGGYPRGGQGSGRRGSGGQNYGRRDRGY
jgi:hypothetical protein